MRMIDEQAIEDIASGSAVLASGGGGDPFRGKLSALSVLSQTGPVPLVTIEELGDDAIIASPFLIGAPIALLEKFPFVDEIERTMRALEKRAGKRIEAVFAAEVGGVNSMVPFTVAARMGIAVLDADTMGRAYPLLDLTLTNLAGISSSPIVITDDYGTEVTVVSDDNAILEVVGRTVSHKFGASAAAAGFFGTVGATKAGLVGGSISLAERIGVTMRDAPLHPAEAWEEILRYTGGKQLFEGKVSSVTQDIEDGWGKGRVIIEGSGEFDGETLRIEVINENLAARIGSRVIACTPDIITVFDATSGSPLTTENVRYGYRVGVAAIPCDPRWVTPGGIDLGGPRRFAFDFDYHDFRTGELKPTGLTAADPAMAVRG